MGLLDGIGKKIAQSGQDTVKKAKSFADATRINGQIAEEQRAVSAFYSQIGEKYYTLYKDAPADEFSQTCDRITAGLMRIAELQTEVQRLKNTRLCPKCGAVSAANVQFCASCGAELPKQEVQEVPEANYTEATEAADTAEAAGEAEAASDAAAEPSEFE